jgi:hypothetical protein
VSLTGRTGGRTRPAVGAGLALLLTAGCGGSTAPEQTVPELSTRLSAVDQALADHEFSQARRQIARLVRATRAARATGELEAAEAEPILDAAASLVSALPRRESPDRSSQPPATQPDTDEGEQPLGENAGEGEQAREKRQEELEKRREELEKRREELQKKLEEEQKKDEGHGQGGGEEGGGNGESGESGHGD